MSDLESTFDLIERARDGDVDALDRCLTLDHDAVLH